MLRLHSDLHGLRDRLVNGIIAIVRAPITRQTSVTFNETDRLGEMYPCAPRTDQRRSSETICHPLASMVRLHASMLVMAEI